MASREAGPPSGGHRRPPGGSESLRKILTIPPHGRRASSTVPPPCPALAGTVACGQSPIPSGNAPIPSCTPPPMASREAEPPSGGHRRPPGGSESLRKILTMHPHGRRASSTVPRPPVRGHRSNFTKTLRAAGRPPVASGAWPGLSGGHGRRGARRNRALPDGIGSVADSPARAASQFHRSQPLWARSRAGKALFRRATTLFRHAPRRPWPPERPGHPSEATGGLPADRRAFVKF